ncbi:stomatin-like protein 2, mitochondrial [Stegodyphus dumicola]|uniref:stomatin-like protein 2, mitochondrial n=1 Tax=Stegodyphus dumicola TaxID=202533 RepID=UPI0015AD0A5B|nr:stomatin-like protein 2, mitochondrial [Stegodyphus dumicola]
MNRITTAAYALRSKKLFKHIFFYDEIATQVLQKGLVCNFSVMSNKKQPESRSLSHNQAKKLLHFNPKHFEVVRHAHSTPFNTIIMFVPQQEAWIVERMGKFNRILQPGLNFLIPIVDKVKYVQSLKELAIDIPQQSAITLDNVTLNIDGVLYLRVVDPYKASYGVEDPEFAVTQLAQTTMRSELGKISLDSVFRERESLNIAIVDAINKASSAWGIDCLRYEIRDIKLPQRVNEAMQMQVEAERKKRAAILESEGIREADINVAEGKKRSRILASEAEKTEQINKAQGEASAILAKADARAKSLQVVAESLLRKKGNNAASLLVAEQYVSAFSKLAKTGNTLILPSNTNDVSSMVAQAMSIYNNISPRTSESIEAINSAQSIEKDWNEYISDDEQNVESPPIQHNIVKKDKDGTN